MTQTTTSPWAHLFIDTLIQQGVDHFFCAPGSRSSPLLLAIAKHPQANAYVHFDERGLGFQALGYSKAAKRPCAIVVTSGTAVGNLLPALMEADASHIPLIAITADRPPELLDVGANQAYDQIKLFQSSVRYQVHIPTPDSSLTPRYLISTLSQAVLMSQGDLKGPVHINCAFREPFDFSTSSSSLPTPTVWQGKRTLSAEQLQPLVNLLSGPGVIIAAEDCETQEVLSLAKQLGWPIFPDILSPLRSFPHLITHYDLILKTSPHLQVEQVIHCGGRLVSKTLLEWLKRQPLTAYLHVADHPRRHDPDHLVTHRIQGPLAHALPHHPSSECLTPWLQKQQQCQSAIKEYFSTQSGPLTQLQFFFDIQQLPSEWALFLGNSLPIREANMLFNSQHRLFGNRGVSGIDGNIATAVGIAQALHQPVAAILGDLTTLHDLNSLALIKELNTPFILFVINNQGGGIFSFLEVSQETEHFEKFIAGKHHWNFEHAAALFHLPYHRLQSRQQLQELLHTPTSCIVEICTQRQDNLTEHLALHKAILYRT